MNQPTWLDASFVEKVLQNDERDDSIKVSGITVEPAVAEGDNWMSDIYRVSVICSRINNGHGITETRSLIAKVELQDGITKMVAQRGGFFGREISMMTETLPRMNESLTAFGAVALSPRCLRVKYGYPICLFIEDLAQRGFRMTEHRVGLDLDHSLLAIRNIAVFHAASVALIENKPETRTNYAKNVRGIDGGTAFASFIDGNTKAVGEEVAKWSELSPRISEKICKLSEIACETMCEASLVLEDDFNVLNHGDCTMLNMLFRYNEEREPIEQIFVDFQTACYASPALDILHFFGSSLSANVRLDNRELLIREYHESLTGTMTALKCSTKVPTLKSLHDTLRKRAFCEVVSSLVALAFVVADRREVKSTDDVTTETTGNGRQGYRSKRYREIMTRVLPYFDSMGLLDV